MLATLENSQNIPKENFKEFTLIVLENMLDVILISSAALAFGRLKNNG